MRGGGRGRGSPLPPDTVARDRPSGERVPGIVERGERGGNRGIGTERQRAIVAEEREEEDGALLTGQIPARGIPVLDAQIRLEAAPRILRSGQPTAPPNADGTRVHIGLRRLVPFRLVDR